MLPPGAAPGAGSLQETPTLARTRERERNLCKTRRWVAADGSAPLRLRIRRGAALGPSRRAAGQAWEDDEKHYAGPAVHERSRAGSGTRGLRNPSAGSGPLTIEKSMRGL